jgi:hypothetical protein
MGQAADNAGRNASLDEKKRRMAGRRGRTGQAAPGREEIREQADPNPLAGKVGGASGRFNRGGEVGGTKEIS